VQQLFSAAFAQIHANEILRAFESDNAFMNPGLLDGINAKAVDEVTLNFKDDEEARIVDVSKIINSRFDFGQVQYYGENTFRIPFEAETEATLDYFLLKTPITKCLMKIRFFGHRGPRLESLIHVGI
jgi:hypothetical protein